MNVILWILQGILAAMFLLAGFTKITQPKEKQTKTMITRFSMSAIRFIGVADLLAAIGVILPWLLQILPVLTPFSAVGIVLIMALAIYHHAKYKETGAIVINTILLLMAAFVAYARFNILLQ